MPRPGPGLAASFFKVPLGVRVLMAVTGGCVALYLASTILRAPGSSVAFFDVWVNNFGYAGCAALCAWRAID